MPGVPAGTFSQLRGRVPSRLRSAEILGPIDCEDKVVGYSCALCGETTADDPRRVRMELSWDHSEASQELGARFACLQAALRPGFPLYDGLE